MLEGSLGDFSLPDIFQLIALTKKTGTLTVHAEGQEGRVLFYAGEVTFAVSDVERVAMGARLVAAGLVDAEQVTRALERRHDEGTDLLAGLLEHAELDEEAVNAFLRRQIEDAVFDLLRLDSAGFSFDAGSDGDPPGPSVATEQLIEEGHRRLEAWSAIREHVPSIETVLALSPDPEVEGDTVAVERDDWRLLALVDGRRSVRDLVELTGEGEFATSKRLADFVARGFVRVAAADAADSGSLAGMVARRDMLRRLEELELGHAVARPEPEPPAEPAAQPAPELVALVAPAEHADAATADDEQGDVAEAAEQGEVAEGAEQGEVAEGADEQDADDGTLELDDDQVVALPEPTSEPDDEPAAVEQADAEEAPAMPPAPAYAEYDRSQAAREFASLGVADGLPAAPRKREADELPDAEAADDAADPSEAADTASSSEAVVPPHVAAPGGVNGTEPGASQLHPLGRDEDVNRGLLLRLIDGVKGA